MLDVPHCTVIKSLGGVKLPGTVVGFDCRSPDDAPNWKAPYGETLWSSERAAYALGLRKSYAERFDTTPLSCTSYQDFRKCSEDKLAEIANEWHKEVRRMRREYHDALKSETPNEHGGSVYYKPVAVVICNYGWSIMCDERLRAVRYFGP